MSDVVLRNKNTGGQYVLGIPAGVDQDAYIATWVAAAGDGWVQDKRTDPSEVIPPDPTQPAEPVNPKGK